MGRRRSAGLQLIYALALLLATGAALALSATGRETREAAPPVAERAVEDQELDPDELVRVGLAATPRAARGIERVRGLEFSEGVPEAEAITGARLSRLERRELERTNARRGLAVDEAEVRILGLLAEDEELEDAVAASGELAAAAYDPRTDRLFIVSDAVAANAALVEFLLAHELTHALEDQRFGRTNLNRLDDDDQALAQLALSEGTATAAMVDYASRYLDPLELTAASAGLSSDTGDVPGFVVDQLEWAYLGGMEFVESLREIAGGWKLADYAIGSRPPFSTEQVLHPEKYIRDERPAPVRIDRAPLRERGWRPIDAGVAGEFSTGQLLELGVAPSVAARAAAGWDGDRYELFERDVRPAQCSGNCREDLVLVLRWRWDERRDAVEFERAALAYAREALAASPAGGTLKLAGGGYLAIGAGRGESTLAFAPTAALAEAALGGGRTAEPTAATALSSG